MRPRVFPAEDMPANIVAQCSIRFNEAAGIPRGRLYVIFHCIVNHQASMRPRVFPAEDSTGSASMYQYPVGFNEAAGIPRGRHDDPGACNRQPEPASMRPRVFPAEDSCIIVSSS